MADSPHVIDVSTATFEQDVIAASRERLVVVDFWAPWCEPCRHLAPILESLAAEHAGRFVLAKINVDENPEIAQQVQSIPLVLAFQDGQPVDQFQGAVPEPQIREWLGRLLPSPADDLVAAGRELEGTDPQAAEAKFREAAELKPDDDTIRIHIARALVAQQRFDEATAILDELAKRGFLEPEAEQLKSQIELRHAAEEAGGVDEARKAAEASPDDLGLQVQLADALAVAGRHREALEMLVEVIGRDRDGDGGQQAKAAMLKVFDLLGPSSELVGEFRRKLATALY